MIPAAEALERLREGNRRFASKEGAAGVGLRPRRPLELPQTQQPFAIVLGCSDSRVAPEIVFDQELGDLFVIRVAGNVVVPALAGSVEFGVDHFGTALVVVLGHSRCGAILATLEEHRAPSETLSPNLRPIVDRVLASIEGLLQTDPGNDPDALVEQAVRLHVRISANDLRHGSPGLERMIRDGQLLVVGATYSLETGVVDFFDGVPGVS